VSGIAYPLVTAGLLKARGFGLVEVVASEDRGYGSMRHRYAQASDSREAWARMARAHDVATRREEQATGARL
jgi:hypothetical protein